jgi:hypothetical protein
MAEKYTNIFHCKALQNLTTLGFFGSKMYHLATLLAIHIFGFFNIAGNYHCYACVTARKPSPSLSPSLPSLLLSLLK